MRYFFIDGSHQKGLSSLGGWAVIETKNNQVVNKWSGTSDFGDSVTMEMEAAIQALKKIYPKEEATIYTDSQYLVKGVTLWVSQWIKHGWITKKKEPVANKKLWLKILELSKNKKIKWVWVKGHNGNFFNELADNYAGSYSNKLDSLTSNTNTQSLNLGDLFRLSNPDKRYIFIQKTNTHFIVCNIANAFGQEMEVIPFDLEIIKLIPSNKEKGLIIKYLSHLKDKFSIKLNY